MNHFSKTKEYQTIYQQKYYIENKTKLLNYGKWYRENISKPLIQENKIKWRLLLFPEMEGVYNHQQYHSILASIEYNEKNQNRKNSKRYTYVDTTDRLIEIDKKIHIPKGFLIERKNKCTAFVKFIPTAPIVLDF